MALSPFMSPQESRTPGHLHFPHSELHAALHVPWPTNLKLLTPFPGSPGNHSLQQKAPLPAASWSCSILGTPTFPEDTAAPLQHPPNYAASPPPLNSLLLPSSLSTLHPPPQHLWISGHQQDHPYLSFLLSSSARGLPWWFNWSRICLQYRRPGFNPWVGKIPWRREQLSTLRFWSGESHGLSMGSQRVRRDWATFTFTFFHQCWDAEDYPFWLTVTLFNSAPALILGNFNIPSDNHPKALASCFLSSHPPVLFSALHWPPRFSVTFQACH